MSVEYYEASALIACGELKPVDLSGFRQSIRTMPDGRYTIRVEKEKRSRSQRQNRFWWGTVVPLFAERCGYTKDEMHEVLKFKLLPRTGVDPTTGEEFIYGGSTAGLSSGEFNILIEAAQRLGSEWGVYIPDPNEQAA